jgi:hypothetical protein
VHQILYELVACGIISDRRTEEYKELTYQPARDINTLTIKFVIESLEDRGIDNIPVAQTAGLKVISEILQTFREEIKTSRMNTLLKDIGEINAT